LGRYILQRLFAMVLTLFAVSVLTFVLMHTIPGGPFTREKKLPQSTIDALNEKYNLDEPLWKQYTDYMWGVISKGDMGPSFKLVGRSVDDVIASGLPITARIGVLATILTLLIGIPLGVISALKQNRWQDYTSMLLTTLGVTIPSFVIAILLIYVFCVRLGWFPVLSGRMEDLTTLVLPTIALSAYSLSFITRLMRSSMLDVSRQDYIRTARAKGLSEFRVIARHAVKNAIIPVVTYVGPMFSGLLTGSFVIEKLFTIAGIGRFFVESIENRDYTMIMGMTILDAALLIFINFLVDVAYGFIDPRIKFTGVKEE
jgi:oligopeptide transport system permease protein